MIGNTLNISQGNSVTLPDLTYTAGEGIQINGANEISNLAPDQIVSLAGQGTVAISGTYPAFTIASTDPDEDPTNEFQRLSILGNRLTLSDGNFVDLPPLGTVFTAGTGISIDVGINEITNLAPDQEVTIGSVGDIAVQGTYPNFVLNYTNPDPSPTNEIQTLSIVGNQLSLSQTSTPITLPSIWTEGVNGTYYDTQNVGIGITEPKAALHISGLENDGNNTTLRITTPDDITEEMYLDGNEINGMTDGLALNNISTFPVILAEGGGNVGIGRFWVHGNNLALRNPSQMLVVRHRDDIELKDGLGIQNEAAPADTWYFHHASSNGDLALMRNGIQLGRFDAVSGAYLSTSDVRVKKNISLLSGILPRLVQLEPKSYHFEHQQLTEEKDLGFMAQELKELFPELVSYSEALDRYAVDYAKVSVVAVQAIKEQQQLIEQQQQLLEQQQAYIKQLDERLKRLENR